MGHYIIGVHTGHDRGAALLCDGVLVGAISQERLDRHKYSRSYMLPYEAMDTLIEYFHISWQDISCIAISGDAVEIAHLMNFYKTDFVERYHIPNMPFFPVSHHLAHAYSAYFLGGEGTHLILVADGGGDFVGDRTEAESLYLGHDGEITLLEQRLQDPPNRKLLDMGNHFYPFMPFSLRGKQISIGRKYEQVTYLLKFQFGQAGKTMGLASYGHSFVDYSFLNWNDLNFSLSFEDVLKEIYIKEQLSGLSHAQFMSEYNADIAATIQNFTEYAVTSLVKNLCNKYQIYDVCLAGGLFLNCLMNHKILEHSGINNIFIVPPAGDDGQAIGAAMAAHKLYFNSDNKINVHMPYLGLDYTNEEIERAIKCKNLSYSYMEDHELAVKIANFIAEGKIIGIHRGRTEIGPRALCHRSIFADATNPKMKDILNRRVKHREFFRPFAPIVTYEDQFDIFDLKRDSPYMLFAATVKEQYRSTIPAVTHEDGTARVQSIRKTEEPFIYDLLQEFRKIKGIPVILNTSFNVNGEPIVETPQDAIQTFLKTNIDVAVIGNYLVCKDHDTGN